MAEMKKEVGNLIPAGTKVESTVTTVKEIPVPKTEVGVKVPNFGEKMEGKMPNVIKGKYNGSGVTSRVG